MLSPQEKSLLEAMLGYCQVNSFDKKIEELSKYFGKEKVLSSAETLAISVSQGSDKIAKELKQHENIDLHVFLVIGCGKTDAFAIPYKGHFAVFFDFTTLMNQKRENAPLVFIV